MSQIPSEATSATDATTGADVGQSPGEGSSEPSPGTMDVWLLVVGAAIAVLAPLGGFLGGSMSGLADEPDALDPLFLWLFVGLVVGGGGVVLAAVGGLRWVRTNRSRW